MQKTQIIYFLISSKTLIVKKNFQKIIFQNTKDASTKIVIFNLKCRNKKFDDFLFLHLRLKITFFVDASIVFRNIIFWKFFFTIRVFDEIEK